MRSPEHKSFKHQQIEKTRTTAFVAVAIAAIVVSVALVFVRYLYNWWAYNSRVYDAQEQVIDDLNANIQTYDELVTEYVSFENAGAPEGGVEVSSKDVLDALPSNYDFNALNSSLQYLANRSGVSLDSIGGEDLEASASDTSYTPEPEQVDFSIEVLGSYEEIQEFVDIMDRSIRPMVIVSMEMAGNDQQMSLELSGYTYYQPAQNLDFPSKEVN